MAVRFGQSLKMTRRRDLQPYMGLEIAKKRMKKKNRMSGVSLIPKGKI